MQMGILSVDTDAMRNNVLPPLRRSYYSAQSASETLRDINCPSDFNGAEELWSIKWAINEIMLLIQKTENWVISTADRFDLAEENNKKFLNGLYNIEPEIIDKWENITVEEANKLTMEEKKEYAKYLMSHYFYDHPEFEISNAEIENSFEKIVVCNTEEEFLNKVVEDGIPYFPGQLEYIEAYTKPDTGEIVLRNRNGVVTIIHEVNHTLGDVYLPGVYSTDIDEAFTESLAMKIAGEKETKYYTSQVAVLDEIIDLLEDAGYEDIEEKTYYSQDGAAEFANLLNDITGDSDFYTELDRNMNIAHGGIYYEDIGEFESGEEWAMNEITGMTVRKELFDRRTVPNIAIPFDLKTYLRYLDGLVTCDISLKGYDKDFLQSLKKLANMVYGNIENKKQEKYMPPSVKSNNNGFSPSVNSTLDKMRKNY